MARPNILLIHCHDLGQHLGCYGIETVRTPHLDQLAADGVRFARSYCASPSCSPSRAAIFTGRWPHSNGVMGLCHADFAWDLHADEQHLAQLLAGNGYATAAVGVIHETASGAERCGYQRYAPPARAAAATDAALGLLDELSADEAPWYLCVGFIEPHRLPEVHPETGIAGDNSFPGPGLKPDDELGVQVPPYLADTPGTRWELAGLQGALAEVDRNVGRLLARLAERGLAEDTLVVFTTDHGIAMPRAKCSLYEPGISTALILRLPSRAGWHGGRVVEPLISNIDYLPTLLELVGVEAPAAVQGRSFAPLLDSDLYEPRQHLFSEMTYHDYYDPRRAVRNGRYKLIANFTSAPEFMDCSQSWRPVSDVASSNHAVSYHPPIELYDLENDPAELINLADEPGLAEAQAELLAALGEHLRATDDPILSGAVGNPLARRTLALL
mgnify:CR=1 FL=1